MNVWRLAKAKHIALDGLGSSLYPGRWNQEGQRVVYTSAHASLAVLEKRVHCTAPVRDLVLIEIFIPDDSVEDVAALPYDWQSNARVTKSVGSAWYEVRRSCVLKVPSVHVPMEYNYLINASHAGISVVRRIAQYEYDFDDRLF